MASLSMEKSNEQRQNVSLFNADKQRFYDRTQSLAMFTSDKEQSVKQNQNIIEKQNGSERIISLHGRLQQEAEKIRKWKLQMEMDLKTKVFVSI